MAGPNVTLSDIYIKLEEIEGRLERLEKVIGRQEAVPPAQAVRRFEEPSPKKYYYIQRAPQAPQVQASSQTAQPSVEHKAKEPEKALSLKNWRYLLGLE
ncbi:MAG: hypothetical protein N3G76_02095 [Candidatus Micrarchaeota archaeon]|nr:hypothetical protein [Candidatus Micrarchaeota archaeon]